MRFIYVAGAWGSGTTALTSALGCLGATTLQPTFRTNDERTPDSLESTAFRKIILEFVDEKSLRFIHSPVLVDRLRQFAARQKRENPEDSTILLKLPPAAVCLGQLDEALDLGVVVIQRAFDEIERSRARRNWDEIHGSKGATLIYSCIYTHLAKAGKSFLVVSYEDLIREPTRTLEKVSNFYELNGSKEAIQRAADRINQT